MKGAAIPQQQIKNSKTNLWGPHFKRILRKAKNEGGGGKIRKATSALGVAQDDILFIWRSFHFPFTFFLY